MRGMLPPAYWYLQRYGWHETAQTSTRLRGYCPIHTEHTPSFDIWLNDGHFYCQGCHVGGDIVRLVKEVEKLDWAEAYARVRELDEGWLPPKNAKHSFRQEEVTHQPATEEQRETMTIAAQFWHEQLLSPAGTLAYEYLLSRGVALSTIRTSWQIGYAPDVSSSQYAVTFFKFLEKQLGKQRWRERAISAGLLYENGSIRLRNRLVFSCCSPANWQEVAFYQARILSPPRGVQSQPQPPPDPDPDPSARPPAKFLNPPNVQKLVFSLPIDKPAIHATIVAESPFGPAVLHQYGIPGMGTLGGGTSHLTIPLLRLFARPFYLCHDNDVDHYRGGKPYKPGDAQAKKFAELCATANYPTARITPERVSDERKGLDEWVCYRGPDPLLDCIGLIEQGIAVA